MEAWRPIPGWERYEVSDLGRVRVGQQMKWAKAKVGQILAQTDADGYRTVNLSSGGQRKPMKVHRLVLLAFRPGGVGDSRHMNGIRHDNRLENLQWGTHAENCADTVAHGRSLRGARHPRAKLTQDQAIEVRSKYASGGETHRGLASAYGVTKSVVTGILNGSRW